MHYDIDYVDPEEVLLGLKLGVLTGIAITALAAFKKPKRTPRKTNTIDPRPTDILR